jgi:hypothetical protein
MESDDYPSIAWIVDSAVDADAGKPQATQALRPSDLQDA